jgi:hypothetical protein
VTVRIFHEPARSIAIFPFKIENTEVAIDRAIGSWVFFLNLLKENKKKIERSWRRPDH